MAWLIHLPLLAVADYWDIGSKIIAAVAVIVGPSLVIWLTRRGNRQDRVTVERTEVEKLYIDGTSNIIRHQHDQIAALTSKLATTEAKLKAAQEEVDVCNRSFAAYQHQYDRLVALLDKSGIPVPENQPPGQHP